MRTEYEHANTNSVNIGQMVQCGKGGGQYETRSAQTQSKKKNSSQNQLETPASPSRGIKNAAWLGMVEESKEVCEQQGVPANNV